MYDSKPINTPVEKGIVLTLAQCPKIDDEKEKISNVPYANVVGSLMYAMLYTQPNIYFAIVLIYCYPRYLGLAHCQTVKRNVCYLHGIDDLILCDQSRGYSDVD